MPCFCAAAVIFCDVEELAAEKIDRADYHHRELIGMLLDEIENVFSANE